MFKKKETPQLCAEREKGTFYTSLAAVMKAYI